MSEERDRQSEQEKADRARGFNNEGDRIGGDDNVPSSGDEAAAHEWEAK